MKTYLCTKPGPGGTFDEVGAVSHKLNSPDEECARATCDAMNWRFDGPLLGTVGVKDEQEGEEWKKPPVTAEPSRKKGKATGGHRHRRHRDTGNPPLTAKQIQALAILARQAFDHLEEYGLVEDEGKTKSARFDSFRRRVQTETVGKDSLRKCRNNDFRPLKAEFLKLAGRKWEDPKVIETGKQSKAKEDSMERRQQLMHLMKRELAVHEVKVTKPSTPTDERKAAVAMKKGGPITEAYLVSIARAQNKGTPLADFSALIALPVSRLEPLLFTLRNRIKARTTDK